MREERPPRFENRFALWAIALIAVLGTLVALFTIVGPGSKPSTTTVLRPGATASADPLDANPVTAPVPPPARIGVFLTTKDAVAQYEDWLGRPVKDVTFFAPRQTWSDITNPEHIQEWQGSKYRLVFALPMLPTDSIDDKEAQMRAGGRGEYNHYFTTLAKNMVDAGQGDAVLRIGWEFNLKSWPWGVSDPSVYIKFFRQIVTTMRAVPGAKFKIDWNPNNAYNPYDAVKYWPGDKYVDTVGVDAYDLDETVYTALYNNRKKCDAICREQAQRTAWNEVIFGGPRGLEHWSFFASKHHKQLALPEWGLWQMLDRIDGGGDDTYFIEQMHDFINRPINNVAYANYFELNGSDGPHSLQDTFKASGKVFKKLFGPQPTATPSATPTP